MKCNVCEEGSVTLKYAMNTLNCGDEVKCWYYECDSCGSTYADQELMQKNIQELPEGYYPWANNVVRG